MATGTNYKYELKDGKYYDARFFESRALDRVKRGGAEYNKAHSWICESTMSCDRQEAEQWAQYYMSLALAYSGRPIADIFHKDIILVNSKAEAAGMFLAAYDIYSSLGRR